MEARRYVVLPKETRVAARRGLRLVRQLVDNLLLVRQLVAVLHDHHRDVLAIGLRASAVRSVTPQLKLRT